MPGRMANVLLSRILPGPGLLLKTMKTISDEDGQATIFVAIFTATVLFGFLAMAIDIQYLFHAKRMAQAAADAAVVAAAEEYGNVGNEQAAANAMAKLNGFDTTLANNPATVTLSTPSTGNYAGSAAYVQATVAQPVSMFFLNAFSQKATVTVSARAVAAGGLSSPTCVCLESPTGMNLSLSNSAQINATNCGITVDSSSSNAVGVVGNASINALSLGMVSSTWNYSSNVKNSGIIYPTTKIISGITSQCKPVITPPSLPNGIACYNNPIQGWNAANNYTGIYTLPLSTETTTSKTLCLNSLDTSDSAQVNFSPGYTYYVKGDFKAGGGAALYGSGVTFYVGGNINLSNGANSTLAAPTVGSNPPVPQTLFYAMGNTVTIQGGASSSFSGLIYAPNAAVSLTNGSGTSLNMDLVAKSLTMTGNAKLQSYASSDLGTLNISVAKLTE